MRSLLHSRRVDKNLATLVTSYTNAVTMQVLGNVKSCISIIISVAIFGNELAPLQAAGVVLCLFGVWLFERTQRQEKAAQTAAPVHCDNAASELGALAGQSVPSVQQPVASNIEAGSPLGASPLAARKSSETRAETP